MNTHSVSYVPNNMKKRYAEICFALGEMEGAKPSVFDMMAIIWTESLGEYFYDCDNCLYKRRLKELEEVTKIKTYEFLNVMRCGKGVNAHKIPRFIFDAGAFMFLKSSKRAALFLPVQLAVASCGIGIATRWHTDVFQEAEGDALWQYLDDFKRNEISQLQTLAHDLVQAGGANKHAESGVFRRFYGDALQHQANAYKAERLQMLSYAYAKYYEDSVRTQLFDPTSLNLNEVDVKTQ